MIKLIECPRDAMQGLPHHLPARLKADYINLLLAAGFDTLDFGSFVSAKAIPQMSDTAEVLSLLDLSRTRSKLLAIVANERGIKTAADYDEISYLGFPFSVSETFQQRNTNSGREASLRTVAHLLETCAATGKQAVIYLSMGFGNPYQENWSPGLTAGWGKKLADMGAGILSLSDTVGIASPETVREVYSTLSQTLGGTEIGVHLHSRPEDWELKIEAAYRAGCRRFDSAIRGYGGCPMAGDSLTGNIATENLVSYFGAKKEVTGLDIEKLNEAINFSARVFG